MPSPTHFSAREPLPPLPPPLDSQETFGKALKHASWQPQPSDGQVDSQEKSNKALKHGSWKAKAPAISLPAGDDFQHVNSEGSKASHGSSVLKRRGSKIYEVTEATAARLRSMDTPPSYLLDTPVSVQALGIIRNKWFERIFSIILVLNAIEMGLALAFHEESLDSLWLTMDILFAAAFAVESLLTLAALGHRAFLDIWRAIQVFATVAAVGDCFMTVTGLGEDWSMTSRALKSTRFLLLGKLFSVNTETKLIVVSMARSLKSLRGVLVVIIVICYGCTLGVYSVVGLKGDEYDAKGIKFGGQTHDKYFGDLVRTMLTLFSVLILSEWDSVARAVYEVQPYFVPFFFCFTVLLTFGLMNVLVGIIVDTVNQIHQEHEERKKKEDLKEKQRVIEGLVELVFAEDDEISLDQFLDMTADSPEILAILREFNVPWGFTFGDLFSIIDDDKDGHVTKSELADGLFSLVAGDETARFCITQLNMSKQHSEVVQLRTMIAEIASNQDMLADRMLSKLAKSGQNRAPSFFLDSAPSIGAYQTSERKPRMREALSPKSGWSSPKSPSVVKRNRSNPLTSGEDLWDECYSTLHFAVEKHCRHQLQLAYQSLHSGQQPDQPTNKPKSSLLPWTSLGTGELSRQEHFIIRNKLHTAVSHESTDELRKAIDHAIAAGIDASLLTIELTYNDALKRNQPPDMPANEVKYSMEQGDWSSALDLIVESALSNGVDKQLLASFITRLSDTSSTNGAGALPSSNASAQMPGPVPLAPVINQQRGLTSEPSLQGRAHNIRKLPSLRTKFRDEPVADEAGAQVRLLSLLHSEACKHSKEEMSKAWEALEASAEQSDGSGLKPFSQAEEIHFVYNQMFGAVSRKSLPDLQRALSQAVVAGLDIRSLDVEVAYRDALARYHQGTTQTIRLAVDAFRRKEWYLALDLVIQVSLVRGADRQSLLRALTKIYSSYHSHVSCSWC